MSHPLKQRFIPSMEEQAKPVTRVLAGPAHTGKTDRLLDRYRHVLREGPPGTGLWLAPNRHTAADVRDRLLSDELGVCFAPNVFTFAAFADVLVRESSARRTLAGTSAMTVLRPASELMKRSLLRRQVEQMHRAGQLPYFAPIAQTSGFVELLANLISELKRAEIWPDDLAEAAARRGLTAKDRELLAVYRNYQDRLAEAGYYDREGRVWLARDFLARGQRGSFASVRIVVVDGFTDFTRTQYDMLASLAEAADEVLITIAYDPDPHRRELFGSTAATLHELQRRFNAPVEHTQRRRKCRPASLASVEQELFRHPRHRRQSTNASGVQILESPGREGEVRMIARRIKTLLHEGICPSAVAVVLRRVRDYAAMLSEVFAEHGIPLAVDAPASLQSSPMVKAFLSTLQLAGSEWRFSRLAGVLNNSYFQPPWPEWRRGATARRTVALLRRLGIPFGRSAYERALRRLAEGEGRSAAQADAGTARDALALLGRLGRCLDRLPTKGTASDWLAAQDEVATELGIAALLEGEDCLSQRDRADWAQLRDALDQWKCAERLAGETAEMDRHEFSARLGEIVAWQERAAPDYESGPVRVLAASDARNLTVPYLFVAGMAEKQFPQHRGEDPFYSEAERDALNRAGVALGHRTAQLQEEMLLFYQLVTRATKQLVLSYPAVDEKGAPLLASPFLEELRAIFEPQVVPVERREMLDPVPAGDELSGPAAVRIRAVAEADEGRGGLLTALARSEVHGALTENILSALEAAAGRFGTRGFGAFDGLIVDPCTKQQIAERYGPEHGFSPSQLETYGQCPFRFYLSSVLGIAPLEAPDWRSSPAVRGQIVHWVLANLHRRIRQRGIDQTPGVIPPEEFAADFSALLDQAMWAFVPGGDPRMPTWELERRLLIEWGERYQAQHRTYDDTGSRCTPTYFELSFGMGQRAASDMPPDALSVDAPLLLESGEQQVRVCGRIDRVDLGHDAGKTVFNVIDYKTGMQIPNKKAVHDGWELQLPLYVLAVERLFTPLFEGAEDSRAIGLSAAYWALRDKGFKEVVRMAARSGGELREDEKWNELRQTVQRRVLQLVRGIRSGAFPVASQDDDCTRLCPYATVCRVGQVRAMRKEWAGEEE